MRRSVKECPTCGQQGRCYDSRQLDQHVKRLYRCACGEKWTTAEFVIDDKVNWERGKVQKWIDGMGKPRARAAIQQAIDALQALL